MEINIPAKVGAAPGANTDITSLVGGIAVGQAAAINALAVPSRLEVVGDSSNFYNTSFYSTDAQTQGSGPGNNFCGKYTDAGAYARYAVIAGLKLNSTTADSTGYLAFYTNRNGSATGVTEEMRLGAGLMVGTTVDPGVGGISGTLVASGAATSCTGATIGTGSKNSAGFCTATTTGVSTIVFTFSMTAPTGWSILPTNVTTANLIRQSAKSTTTATISGTTVTGDVIQYIAVPY